MLVAEGRHRLQGRRLGCRRQATPNRRRALKLQPHLVQRCVSSAAGLLVCVFPVGGSWCRGPVPPLRSEADDWRLSTWAARCGQNSRRRCGQIPAQLWAVPAQMWGGCTASAPWDVWPRAHEGSSTRKPLAGQGKKGRAALILIARTLTLITRILTPIARTLSRRQSASTNCT